MKWSRQAEEEISRAPFFVRKKVRKRVEEEAARQNATEVGVEHIQSCRKKFLRNMEDEVKGYQVEACFGRGGCPNRAVNDSGLLERIEDILSKKDLKGALTAKVQGPLKLHHEFRISVADCPNACSRPQIVDVGLIGVSRPQVLGKSCNGCASCVEVCREDAIVLDEQEHPRIDREKCLSCGQCAAVCPTGTIITSQRGYRILVGGKLGRHPQLGKDLGSIHTPEEAIETVDKCVEHYLAHSQGGERFGDVLKRIDIKAQIINKD